MCNRRNQNLLFKFINSTNRKQKKKLNLNLAFGTISAWNCCWNCYSRLHSSHFIFSPYISSLNFPLNSYLHFPYQNLCHLHLAFGTISAWNCCWNCYSRLHSSQPLQSELLALGGLGTAAARASRRWAFQKPDRGLKLELASMKIKILAFQEIAKLWKKKRKFNEFLKKFWLIWEKIGWIRKTY